jgi:Tfp pilus assembly protein PilZ
MFVTETNEKTFCAILWFNSGILMKSLNRDLNATFSSYNCSFGIKGGLFITVEKHYFVAQACTLGNLP